VVSGPRLGKEHAGRELELPAGGRFEIALADLPGAGYTWEVEELPDGARVTNERYESRGEGVGGETLHVFEIEGAVAGTLRLRQLQPWQGEAGVRDHYEVKLVNRGR
jgi:predicted secreted protein